jgi:hypothetical protein
MQLRRPLAITASISTAMLLSHVAMAAKQGETCVIFKTNDYSALDMIMQGLTSAGSVALLLVPGEANWIVRAAGVAGITGTVWSIANAYAEGSGDKTPQICIDQGKSSEHPATISIGSIGDSQNTAKQFNAYLGSETKTVVNNPLLAKNRIESTNFDWNQILGRPQTGATINTPLLSQPERSQPSQVAAARIMAQEARQHAQAAGAKAGAAALRAREAAALADTNKSRTDDPVAVIAFAHATYKGEIRNGAPNGYGVFMWDDGGRYEGEVSQGLAYGIETRPNGDRYEGEWNNKIKGNYGVFLFVNGDRYQGELRDSLEDGYGVYTWANGRCYEGVSRNSQSNGWGYEVEADGKILQGYWLDDKLIPSLTSLQ